jgi:hypothetical protein
MDGLDHLIPREITDVERQNSVETMREHDGDEPRVMDLAS